MFNLLIKKTFLYCATFTVLTVGFSSVFAAKCHNNLTKPYIDSYQKGYPICSSGSYTITGLRKTKPGTDLTLNFNLSKGAGVVAFTGKGRDFAITNSSCMNKGSRTITCKSPNSIWFDYAAHGKTNNTYNLRIKNLSNVPVTIKLLTK